MNIFVLSNSPVLSAQYQCDKHVVKMILESAQMLSTVQSKYGMQTQCKPTHVNHPCTKWAGESKANYRWLLNHAKSLCMEYTSRYNKLHAWEERIFGELSNVPPIEKETLTPFVQAMPDEYKQQDPVQAYRTYYIKDKKEFAKWKKGNVPEWYTEGIKNVLE